MVGQMNIKNNILNYLCDRDYIVCMYDDCIYFFNYVYLEEFNDNKIVINLVDEKVCVKGNNLLIVKMTKEELLIKGKVVLVEVEHKNE